jgi:hypothetical protein
MQHFVLLSFSRDDFLNILSIFKPNSPNHFFLNALFTSLLVNNASDLLVKWPIRYLYIFIYIYIYLYIFIYIYIYLYIEHNLNSDIKQLQN